MTAPSTELGGGCTPTRRSRVCGDGDIFSLEDDGLSERLREALRVSGSSVNAVELTRLASLVERSLRLREARQRLWSKERLASSSEDILRLILDARDAGDRDEELWRAFIAAHFGRESADKAVAGQVESGQRFLCAFGSEPRWTWLRVAHDPQSLRCWLMDNEGDLKRLSFGNHRKFESHKPPLLWEVIESFLILVGDCGGNPSAVFDVAPSLSPQARYAHLYGRLRPLQRFGRTARFDFLSLLNDLDLIEVEPDSCHIMGSTGPIKGARKLWRGEKSPRELGRLADELATTLRLPYAVIEDALCNWQKD